MALIVMIKEIELKNTRRVFVNFSWDIIGTRGFPRIEFA